MGKVITIYQDGHTYEIDSDLIYTPWFVAGRKNSKSLMIAEAFREELKEYEEKDEDGKAYKIT